MQKQKINTKALTSFIIAAAFFMSSISGIILYVTPQGRIANWNTWTLLGLGKEQWGAVHTLFVLTLLIAATFHLFVFNWRVFWAYLKKKHQKGIRLKRELSITLSLAMVVLAGTLLDIPPFGSVMAFGKDIKNYWAATSDEPPVPHAEEMTIAEYADKVFRIESTKVVAALTSQGIQVNPDELLGEIAKNNGMAPSEIHQRLASLFPDQQPEEPIVQENMGYGKMTFDQLCDVLHMNVVPAARQLQAKGIIVQHSMENIKALADRHETTPFDVAKLIQAGTGTLKLDEDISAGG